MTNKANVTPQTREQIEYEEAKKNFRMATAKTRLHSSGVDPSKVSQQSIDKVMRIFDDMDYVQQDTQQKTSKVQREAEVKIQKLNQDANQKFGEIQKKYQDLINSLKDVKGDTPQVDIQVQGETQHDAQMVSEKEEVVERTREDIVADVTEKLLGAFVPFMKGPITEKVNEFMSTLDKKTSDIVVKSQDKEQVVVQMEEVKEDVPAEELKKAEEELKQAIYKDIL